MRHTFSWPQVTSISLLLVCTSLVLQFRHKTNEERPPRLPLSEFPYEMGQWRGRNLTVSSDVLSALGPGQFLLRDYGAQASPETNLFIFYPSEERNNEIHSPKICLPGAGWTPLQSGQIQIQRPDGTSFEVNRFIVGKGPERMLVLYWFQGHGRVTSSEFWEKYFLARDAVLQNRTDSALVRIVQPFSNIDGEAEAERQAVSFANQLLPVLDSYIPI